MELKYQTVFLDIQNKIISGYWPEGAMIPTEIELCGMHNVRRITVRRALQERVQLGGIKRTRGKGSFVNGAKRFSEYRSGAISQDGLDLVKPISNHVLEVIEHDRSSQIARHMQLQFKHDGESVRQYRLIKMVDGQPYALMSIFMTESVGALFTNDDWTNYNFIQLFTTKTGKPVTLLSRTISAIIPDDETCDILNVNHGTAHLWMRNTAFTGTQDVVGIAYGVYNGNLYDFAVSIDLKNPPRGLL